MTKEKEQTPEEIEAAKLAEAAKRAAENKETLKTDEPANKTDTVSAGGKTYRFAAKKFIIPGVGPVTSEEAATDAEIIKKILSIKGQGILQEVRKG